MTNIPSSTDNPNHRKETTMDFFTEAQFLQLLENGTNRDKDHAPVVKLFTPDASATWLISEIDPEDQDIAFGLCDLGMGFPELGAVSIAEMKALRGHIGLSVERDLHFEASYKMSVYAEAARDATYIVTSPDKLYQAYEKLKKSGRYTP